MLNIIECFSSFQGEGGSAGEPAVFLRLSGCNLQCPFCDEYQKLSLKQELSINETIKLIQKELNNLPKQNKLLVITGGEPLLQYEPLKELCSILYDTYPDLKIHIETNGTQQKELNIDKYVISPKKITYHDLKECFAFFNNIKPKTEFKIVVTEENIMKLFSILNQLNGESLVKNKIYLQPETSRAPEITELIIKNWNKLSFCIKISTQTHIFLKQQ